MTTDEPLPSHPPPSPPLTLQPLPLSPFLYVSTTVHCIISVTAADSCITLHITRRCRGQIGGTQGQGRFEGVRAGEGEGARAGESKGERVSAADVEGAG